MNFSGKSKMPMVCSMALAMAAIIGPVSVSAQTTVQNAVVNPYAPAAGHAYRHGAFPTKDTHAKMKNWAATNMHTLIATGTQTLSYGGGVNGVGVTSGKPLVYLVVYGNQWGSAGTNSGGNTILSNDSVGAVPYLQSMFKNLGTGGEAWSGSMTQYCDGPTVAAGATSCPAGAPHVGYPTGGAFAGVWYDNSVSSPASATGAQLANEAIRAAAHFGNTTAASNRYVQYMILSPSGTTPDGFNTPSGSFCAWHNYTGGAGVSSPYGDIAFTNMPYVADMGASCGQNSVNTGAAGLVDGFSIVGGHEYAETITDQNPAGGWTNTTGSASNGQENSDECAWIKTGAQAATQNVTMGTGVFAMQSNWSNDTNECSISHVTVGGSSGGTTVLVNGQTVSGISLATNASKMYSIVVPAGQSSLTIDTSGGTGDSDLYVQLGAQPTTTSFLQKSDGATTTEHIAIANPTAGTYYVMVYGYNAPSGVSLVAKYGSASGGGGTLLNVTGISAATGASKYYSVVVPAGRPSVTFKTFGGTGDSDLYVRLGANPTLSTYDKISDGNTTAETITIASPAAGTYFIMVYGYASASGVTLNVTD